VTEPDGVDDSLTVAPRALARITAVSRIAIIVLSLWIAGCGVVRGTSDPDTRGRIFSFGFAASALVMAVAALRRRRGLAWLSGGLAAMAMIGGTPYGDSWYSMDGRVVDRDGRPIHGALVWIGPADPGDDHRDVRVSTDSAGRFHYFESTAPVQFQAAVRVNRQGFQPLEWVMPQSSALSLECIEVVLERRGATRRSRVLRADSTSRQCELSGGDGHR
jgi:hypothetical protein